MQLTTTTPIRRLVYTAGLALTALAVFVGGAAGGSAASGSNALQAAKFIPGVTDFPSRLGEHGERAAEARLVQFVPGVTDFPSRLGEHGERAAEARLAQRSQQVPVSVQTEQSGFDWSAGATGAIAATLLLLGAALAVRTAKRSRVALS